MAKITYTDKVALNEEPSVAAINKVTDDDMNEIKTSVNDLYDQTGGLTPMGKIITENVISKNLLDTTVEFTRQYISSTGTIENGNNNCLFAGYIEVQPDTKYCLSANTNIQNLSASEYDDNYSFVIRNFDAGSVNKLVFTTSGITKYVRITFNFDNVTTIQQNIIDSLDLQLELGDTRTTYAPFFTNIKKLDELVRYSRNVTSIGDWNKLGVETGFYCGSSMSNSPTGITTNPSWWYVMQIVFDGSYIRQIAFSYRNDNQMIYSRARTANTWGSWVPLFESGSNTNGSYIKYEDGTMICWASRNLTVNVTSSYDSVFYSNISGYFPQTFNSTPVAVITPHTSSGLYTACLSTINTTSWGGYIWAHASHSNISTNIQVVAIGRWKA